MKKKMALFFTFLVLGFSTFSAMPASAHSNSNAGAVVAGAVLGLVAGAVIADSALSKNPPPKPHYGNRGPVVQVHQHVNMQPRYSRRYKCCCQACNMGHFGGHAQINYVWR